MIKPIETEYNGYRFRSRLEARWAYFFDLLGIKYEYEPEGIVLSDGSKYLPDFYLIDLDTFAEIKHKGAFSIEFNDMGAVFPKDKKKYAYACESIVEAGKSFLIAFGDPFDAFPGPRKNRERETCLFSMATCRGRVLFDAGEHIECVDSNGNANIHNCSNCDIAHTSIATNPIFINTRNGKRVWVIWDDYLSKHIEPLAGGNELTAGYTARWKLFQDAQITARQTRFEHGETPEAPRSFNDWRRELRPMTDAEFERWWNGETT